MNDKKRFNESWCGVVWFFTKRTLLLTTAGSLIFLMPQVMPSVLTDIFIISLASYGFLSFLGLWKD